MKLNDFSDRDYRSFIPSYRHLVFAKFILQL